MTDFGKKLRNTLSRFGYKLGIIIIIILVFVAGYWLRGTTAQPAPQPERKQSEETAAPQQAQIWTCSMHPQIRLPKPGRCPICNMVLIPLKNNDNETMGSLREVSLSENARKLMEIQTVPVERKFVEANIRMVGKIGYDETRLKYITAWIPGRLDRLFVDYTGVPVKKGDHMVSLYSPDLLTAQEELLQALASVKNVQNSQLSILRETTEATVTAAREKLRLWGLTSEQIANIEKRGKTIDHMTIYAPIGGIVIHKNAQEGMYVNTGTRIYTIADLSEVWVQLDAYESDLMWIRYGQQVDFTTESYPGEFFRGTIAFIDPILTQTTRTVKVRINVANPQMKLKPGMFVRAVARAKIATSGRVMNAQLAGKWICPMHPSVIRDSAGVCNICGMPLVRTESLGYVGIKPTEADKPLVIPTTAALVTGTRAIVYVQLPNKAKPTYEGREIVLGPRAGDYYLVRYGLKEGEQVVTNGNFKLDAELQIRAKPSMMTPEGGGGGGGHGNMNMGGKKKKKAADGMVMKLTPVLEAQLKDIISSGDKVDQAMASADINKIHAAYDLLLQKIKAVEQDKFKGHMVMLWKEYAMLLSNDGVEGKLVKDLIAGRDVTRLLHEHLRLMKKKFNLTEKTAPAQAANISPEFRRQLNGVITDYLAIQEALAADKTEQAAKAAQKALATLKKVDMKLLQGDDHIAWMEFSTQLDKIFKGIATQQDIKVVRKQFALLSELTAAIVTRFGVTGKASLYQFKCPMAFDKRGATWLQADEKTRNPYFGKTMLQCGEVIQLLAGSK